jgi:hypothetical protein
VGPLPAVAGEARVEGAVGVVTDECEVAVVCEADRDDLAVRLERHTGRHVVAGKVEPEVSCLLAVAGEARVERAVGVEAGERPGAEVGPVFAGEADHDDLAVALDRDPVRPVLEAIERSRLLAVAGEARVERAVRVVAGDREEATLRCGADHDDLAVALERHPSRPVVEATEVGPLLAVPGEARVQRPVGVVAGEGEVVVTVKGVGTDRHDLAIGLVGGRCRAAQTEAEVSRLLAVAGERQV